MEHKKPDKPTESLAEWISGKNIEEHKQATPLNGRGFKWHKSKYRPPVEDIKEAELKHEDKELIVPAKLSKPLLVPSIFKYEKEFLKEHLNMKNEPLIEKLTTEKEQLQKDVLKIDSKIINPLGVSDYQVKLLKIQRNAMMTLINVLALRIDDLKTEDDD